MNQLTPMSQVVPAPEDLEDGQADNQGPSAREVGSSSRVDGRASRAKGRAVGGVEGRGQPTAAGRRQEGIARPSCPLAHGALRCVHNAFQRHTE